MARVMPRIACIASAIAALWLAFLTFNEVASAGFPDGHVTDYDKAADGPLGVLSYVEAAFVFLFLALAFWPLKARRRALGLLVVAIAFALVAVITQVGVPWYFGAHVGLDNGIGG